MRHPLECLRACAALPPTFVCVLPCVQGTGTLLLRYACGAVPVQMCTHFGSAVTSGAAARRELKMRKSIVWLQGAGTALVGCIAYLAIKLSAAAEGVAAQGGATKGNLVGLIREQTRTSRLDCYGGMACSKRMPLHHGGIASALAQLTSHGVAHGDPDPCARRALRALRTACSRHFAPAGWQYRSVAQPLR